jgi:Ca2+-binding RTX toxin-like protein
MVIVPLGGKIVNAGTIEISSTGSATDLEILYSGATLTGGGHVTLSDSDQNVIFGGTVDTMLTNIDNTISGAGQIGAGQMTLVNDGTIIADGSNALVIDTGSNIISNSGTLEATGSGGMIIESGLDNSGNLWANGGNIDINGNVTGSGMALISGTGILEFGADSSENVTFADDATGTLKLDDSRDFTGTIAGFDAGNTIDVGDIAFGSGMVVNYTANDAGTGGTLVVSDGTQNVQLSIVGNYTAAGLAANQTGSGTIIAYSAPAVNHILTGGLANDILTGGGANDILTGGAGADILTGGAGSDTFKFLTIDDSAVDTITDFTTGAGGDKLDISSLLIGTGANAVNLSEYVSLRESGGNTIVSVDKDAGGLVTSAQDVVTLEGVTGATLEQLNIVIADKV